MVVAAAATSPRGRSSGSQKGGGSRAAAPFSRYLRPAGIAFDSYASTKLAVGAAAAASPLYTACASGAMPLGGTPLTSAQLQLISDWIGAGAPNN